MKKFRKIKVIGIALCSLVAIFMIGFGINEKSQSLDVNAEQINFVDSQIEIRYKKGTLLEVPSEITVEYNGTEYTASSPVLILPNGNATSQSVVELSMSGGYKLVYSFEVASVGVLHATKEFTVYESLYEVQSASSRIEYTENDTLKVTLADGDTFYYNKPVDITSDYDKPMIEWKITEMVHNVNAKIDAAIIDVRLTDCYDSSNYITIRTHRRGPNATTLRGFANGQQETSLEPINETKSTGGKVIWLSGYYGQANDKNGEPWGTDRETRYQIFYGTGTTIYGQAIRNGKYELKFNTQKNTISVESTNPANETELVTDLDNMDIYGDDLFKGFSTGEVYLSISALEYNQETLEMEIYSLFEEAVTDNSESSDTLAPVIAVNYTPTEGEAVYAAQGLPFKIFQAAVEEINLLGRLQTSVYYNYGNEELQHKIPVKNGEFVPNSIGEYTIVYTATDMSRNTTTVTVPVYCVAIEHGLKIDTEILEEVTLLKRISLPDYSFEQVNVGMPIELEITAKSAHDEQKINTETLQFIPLYNEEYTITYSYADNVYSGIFEYTVSTVKGNEIFYEVVSDLVLPRYFIKGMTYSLPNASVFVSNDENGLVAKCALSYDGGITYTEVDRKAAKIDGVGSVIVRYSYKDKYILSDPVPIIDVNYDSIDYENEPFLAKNYFQGDFTALIECDPETGKELMNREIVYRSNQTSGENTLEYINPVSASNFILSMKIPKDTANFSGLRVTLYDYYDRTKSVKWEYELINGVLYFSVNNGWKHRMGGTLAGRTLALTYNSSMQMIDAGEKVAAESAFNFSTDKCLFDITLYGISGTADITIGQINSQVFSSVAGDYARPEISYDAEIGVKSLGDEITIYACDVTDVLSSVLDEKCLVSVRDPDGNVVKSVDGVSLSNVSSLRNYRVKLDKYGAYRITYQAEDNRANITSSNVFIYVEDCKAPMVSFADGSVDGGKMVGEIGKTHTVKDLKIQDDVSIAESVKIVVRVFDSNYQFVEVVDGKFELKNTGTYTVFYNCYDEAGNLTCISYHIVVL